MSIKPTNYVVPSNDYYKILNFHFIQQILREERSLELKSSFLPSQQQIYFLLTTTTAYL